MICAKRFLVAESLFDDFTKAFVEQSKALPIGDPMKEGIKLGPLAYAGPDNHSRLARLPCCLPPTRNEVGILIYGLSQLNSPAHRCLCLRFKKHLAMSPARLEARMDSLLPFL
jgi:hypothetical protein